MAVSSGPGYPSFKRPEVARVSGTPNRIGQSLPGNRGEVTLDVPPGQWA